ncbi:hypothetical protein CHELA40_13496 [Chelatococcus asaccharovorans]|nr:hypothetical protein CHELA40_13496 [Chelatococcus asaccharovorans]CAH1677619.1 hypothetical protein CHELA17_62124 [Chelatococcus asaccharovorans]
MVGSSSKNLWMIAPNKLGHAKIRRGERSLMVLLIICGTFGVCLFVYEETYDPGGHRNSSRASSQGMPRSPRCLFPFQTCPMPMMRSSLTCRRRPLSITTTSTTRPMSITATTS